MFIISFLITLGVSTVETNRDRDRPSCRDLLLKTVENIHHVEINFFFSRLRFLKSRFFGPDLSSSRYLSRSSRQIETVEIYQDFQDLSRIFEISRHNRDFFKTFSRLQAQKSWQIEKSWSRNVITLTNSQSDLDKLSRFAKNVMSRHFSWSRSRLFGLFRRVETKSRFLNLDLDRD
jgi:hypothetical protein